MPLLMQRLSSDKWTVKEGGVLALGAAAGGTISGMVPMLPQLIPSLLSLIENKNHPLLVSITCWTVSRLSSWLLRLPDSQLFERLVRDCATLLSSNSRRVQEGAMSCLGVCAEESWALCKRAEDHNVIFDAYVLPVTQALGKINPFFDFQSFKF
jgi:transportin-1